MLLPIGLIIIGFALLIKGADWLVSGASALAKKNQVSDLAIGLTIVAFGTSAPELVVNSVAALEGHADIVLGNIIGSNNFNLFVILGIAGLIYPITVQSSTAWKEIPISLLAALLLLVLANDLFLAERPTLSRGDAALFLGAFLLFLYYVFRQMKADPSSAEVTVVDMSNAKIWTFIALGLGGLILGGKLVVDNAIDIATSLGVSQKVIGLTIIAAGTSLPELMTSVVAALRKNSDIAIGNVVGSNIFNILLILGVSTVIRPIEYNAAFNLDIYLLLGGTTFLLVAMLTGQRKKLDRWEAGLMLAFFVAYTVYLIGREG